MNLRPAVLSLFTCLSLLVVPPAAGHASSDVASRHASSGAAAAREEPFYCTSTCRYTDPRRDAPARADMVSARIKVTRTITVRVKVRDLGRTGRLVVGAGEDGWGRNYFVSKTRRGTRVQYQTVSEVQVYPKEKCRGAKVAWGARRNVVRLRVSRSCADIQDMGIVNGLVLRSGGAVDRLGKVWFRP